MLRLHASWAPRSIYTLGCITRLRAGYIVCTLNCGQPLIEGSGGVEQYEIESTVTCGAQVTDTAPDLTLPGLPPCLSATGFSSCLWDIGTAPPYITSLESVLIGNYDTSSSFEYSEAMYHVLDANDCAELLALIDEPCNHVFVNIYKAVTRLYLQSCSGFAFSDWLACVDPLPPVVEFGPYNYYSEPFACDAIPVGAITLNREPFTAISAGSSTSTVCGQTFTRVTPAVPASITITLT